MLHFTLACGRFVIATGLMAGVLAGCAPAPSKGKFMFPEGNRWGEAAKRRYAEGEAIPPGGGRAMVGKAYQVDGRTYVPKDDPSYDKVGMASWYGIDFHGRDTSNGEVYDRHTLSAAHTTLPLPSYARVTNLQTGKSVIVRVNDRGPFVAGREIDLSEKAADMLGYKSRGIAQVRVQYVGPAPVKGSDQAMLAATYREGGQPSVAADRAYIARAEGTQMPATGDAPVMVARLDTPAVIPSRFAGQKPGAGQIALPPMAAEPLATQTRRPLVSVPQEILSAVGTPPAQGRRRLPTPDDSLPIGLEAPQSYAAGDRRALEAIFQRVIK